MAAWAARSGTMLSASPCHHRTGAVTSASRKPQSRPNNRASSTMAWKLSLGEQHQVIDEHALHFGIVEHPPVAFRVSRRHTPGRRSAPRREKRQHQPVEGPRPGAGRRVCRSRSEAAGQVDGTRRESIGTDRGDDAPELLPRRRLGTRPAAPRRRQVHRDRRRTARPRRSARRRGRRRHGRCPSPSRPPIRRGMDRTGRSLGGRPTMMTRTPSLCSNRPAVGIWRRPPGVPVGTTAPGFPTDRRTPRSRGDGRWAGRSGPRRVASRPGVHEWGAVSGWAFGLNRK